MKVIGSKMLATSPEPLVRLQASGGWVVGDNDMNTVYVLRPGANRFVPAVQALWLSKTTLRPTKPGVVVASNVASRAYLGWLAALPDGGAVLSCKFGCKEPYKAGIPMDKLDWGSCLVCFNKDGTVRWSGRYNAHKGNAQVVYDPLVTNVVVLVASTGICWDIRLDDGKVLNKRKFPIGTTGEKNSVSMQPRGLRPSVMTLSFVGYSASPAAILRAGIDSRSVPVASKPPYEMGPDQIYCRTVSSWQKPLSVWWAAVLNGNLRYNFVGPGKTSARWGIRNLPSAGDADCMDRQAPVLFQIVGNKKQVGTAFRNDGAITVKPLATSDAGKVELEGNFPALAGYSPRGVYILTSRGSTVESYEIEY